MADHQLRVLARRLASLERKVLQQKQPNLGYSSIDGGALQANDDDGVLTMIMGTQFDGTNAPVVVVSPAPPKPTLPLITAQQGALRIYWDGTFTDGDVAPMDFARVTVYARPLASYVEPEPLNQAIIVGTFQQATGGELTAALDPGVEYAVYLYAWNLAGKYGPASDVATGTPGDSTDGVGPVASPQPEVIPGIGAFYLRWDPAANADPVRYEVHVSDADGFTPSADSLYSETSAYAATVRSLPKIDPGTGEPTRFTYTQSYYFRLVAKDEDGAAPAGAQTPSSLIQITGPDVAADTITGQNIVAGSLTGDLLSGNILLGSTISTGTIDENGEIVGARVELGPDGLINYDSLGNPVISFPLAGDAEAYIRAHVDMLSAEVRDNLTMHGTNNSIAKDGKLALSEGVVPPTAVPQVSFDYDRVQLDTTTAAPSNWSSTSGHNLGTFAFSPSQATSVTWDESWKNWVVCQQRSNGTRIWRFTATGDLQMDGTTNNPWVYDFGGTSQAVVGPGEALPGGGHEGWTLLFNNGGTWAVLGYHPSGSSHFNSVPSSWILTDGEVPSIGYDPTAGQYMMVQNSGGAGSTGVLHIRRFTVTDGPLVNNNYPPLVDQGVQTGPAGSSTSVETKGVVYGKQINGSTDRLVKGNEKWYTIDVYDSTLVRKNTDGAYEQWPAESPHLGITHDGVQFATIHDTGQIVKYTDWNWPALSSRMVVGATLYDSDPAGSTANPHPDQTAGTHETPIGSKAAFDAKRRAKMMVTMPEAPDGGLADDADKWRLYWYRGTVTTPASSDYKRFGEIGSPTARTSVTISADPTGPTPPTTNNFPLANPARITSASKDGSGNPNIELKGDGSYRLGTLSSAAPLKVFTVTATTNNTLTAAATISFGHTYPSVPKILATTDLGSFNVAVTSKSTTDCTVTVRHIDGVNTSVSVNIDVWVIG